MPAEAPDTVILNLAWQQRNFHEGNRLPVLLNPNPGHERIKRFCSLFAGRTDVWGALHGQAVKELVTPAHYDLHLQGRVSLGIYPLTPSGVVRWFAIDIDRHDPTLALGVIAALSSLGIDQGLYLERSKGKGFHIIVLLLSIRHLKLISWTPAQCFQP